MSTKAEQMMRTMNAALRETASHRPAPAAISNIAVGGFDEDPKEVGRKRSLSTFELDLDRIERDSAQPRTIFDDEAQARLINSIDRRGLLQRIVVRWDELNGSYFIVSGERRYNACKALRDARREFVAANPEAAKADGRPGFEKISCDVLDNRHAPEDIPVLQGIENLIRDALKPIEEATLFRRLLTENGWTQGELSAEFGVSQPAICHALSLLEAAPAVQARVDSRELATSVAREIVRQIDDHEAQAQVAERIVAGNLTRPEAVKLVEETAARAPKPKIGKGRAPAKSKEKPRPTAATIRTPGGAKVTVEHRKGLDDEATRAYLLEALEVVRARLAPATIEAREPTDDPPDLLAG